MSLLKNILFVRYDSSLSYYWLCFTILTGFWEMIYILQHNYVINLSENLLSKREHVWLTDFDLNILFPWKLSPIFYSEYGAYADREYMTNKDIWSLLIEGTHCLLCGFFSLLSLLNLYIDNIAGFHISLGISMGSQLMNSILYMGEYGIQIKNSKSVNYNSSNFPCGKYLIKRPFMWINIFWTIMPSYVLIYHLITSKCIADYSL